MLGALLYLRLTSAKNWLRSRLRRLRQPKYLFGAIVGCAYFYFFFFRNVTRPSTPAARRGAGAALRAMNHASPEMMPAEWLPVAMAIGVLILFVILLLTWVVPTRRAVLGFTEAEIAFLFPAPITRRALVHFRLLSGQFRSLLGAAVMMLFTNRWTFLGGNAFTHAIGWWFIFSALGLHFNGVAFTLTRLSDRGLHVWWRRALVLVGLAGVVASTAWRQPLSGEIDLPIIKDWVIALTNTAPLAMLLWPLKLVLAPFLALTLRDFLFTLAPALAIITLHYLWVVNTAVAFEESSLEYAQKRSARIAAWRSGQRRMGQAPTKGRPPPFRLASSGRPELAFLWKNLLSTWPYFTPRFFLGFAAAIVAAAWWLHAHAEWRPVMMIIGSIATFFGAYMLIIGPQFARQDIRSDLANADILKTFPLAGWQIILGELLTPVAILTGLLWLAVLTLALTFQGTGQALAWLTPSIRVTAALALALILPALVTLQLIVPNAAALIFPAWFQTARTQGGGPEVMGQRMIFFFAQVLTMAIALLPAAALAALMVFVGARFIGPVAAISITAVAVLVVLVVEAGFGVWFLGQRFERLDLSSELRA